MQPQWSTACPDWERRILARESLVPFDPLYPEEAAAALEVFGSLRLIDVLGQPSFAECSLPWAFDLPRALFGSYDAASGRRLIRNYFLSVAKKNMKSTLAAGVMVTALVRNWRESGEYYVLAPSKEIADNSFFPARDMVRADPALRDLFHVREDHRTITHRNTKAFLKVVAADSETVGGKKTIGLLVDELWQFGKRANAGAMIREAQGGLAARPEGFVIYLTTQSNESPSGVFEQKLTEFRAIRDGKVHDPRSLAMIYEFPHAMIVGGAYREPENLYIPNPNLGKSVDEEYLLDERARAERAGMAEVINFEAKHLNVQVGINMRADGWVGAMVWDRGTDPALAAPVERPLLAGDHPALWNDYFLPVLDALAAFLDRCEVCTIGFDGGGLDDLFGASVIGREKGTKHHLAWAHALISDIGIARRKANIEDYDRFEREGTLSKFVYLPQPPEDAAPPANVVTISEEAALERKLAALPVNIRFAVELVRRVKKRGLLAQVGVDAAGIGAIVDALGLIGVTQDSDNLDAVRQGIALMNAVKTTEIKLADYTFRHGGTALMAWCIGNLKVIPTRTAMMVARDESGFGKVDPAMAMFDAEHLMGLNPMPSIGEIAAMIA